MKTVLIRFVLISGLFVSITTSAAGASRSTCSVKLELSPNLERIQKKATRILESKGYFVVDGPSSNYVVALDDANCECGPCAGASLMVGFPDQVGALYSDVNVSRYGAMRFVRRQLAKKILKKILSFD